MIVMVEKSWVFIGVCLASLILGLSVVHAQSHENKVYLIDLNYDAGVLSLNDVVTKAGFPPETPSQSTQAWRIDLISFQDQVLYSSTFDIPNVLLQVPPLEGEPAGGGPIILENLNFSIIVPYYPNGRDVNIFANNGTLVLSADVSQFASCNLDSICEHNENYQTCPEDCAPVASSNLGGTGIVQSNLMYLVALVTVIAVSVLVFIIRMRKK